MGILATLAGMLATIMVNRGAGAGVFAASLLGLALIAIAQRRQRLHRALRRRRVVPEPRLLGLALKFL